MSAKKRCTQCAEMILYDAKVCKYCSHRFSDEELARQKSEFRAKNRFQLMMAVALVIAFFAWLSTDEGMNQFVSWQYPDD